MKKKGRIEPINDILDMLEKWAKAGFHTTQIPALVELTKIWKKNGGPVATEAVKKYASVAWFGE